MSLNNTSFSTSVDQQSNAQFSDEILDNISSKGKSVPDEVLNFVNQYQPPELMELDEKVIPGFLEKFIKPRLRYNLLTQDVELDGESLRRHETENLKVEDRIQVICRTKHQVIFDKQRPFKNSLLDIIGKNHYHPVKEYLESLQKSPISQVTLFCHSRQKKGQTHPNNRLNILSNRTHSF